LEQVQKDEGVRHKTFMDNYFISPKLNYIYQIKINSYSTIHHNRKGMPPNFCPKYLCLKRGNTASRVQENLRDVYWKDK
jgi:hypothetical protein